MTIKPLWQQFYEMTNEESNAYHGDVVRRIKAGEMTDEQIKEWRSALKRSAEEHKAESARLQAESEQTLYVIRLARAAGCPENVPVLPWLAERGLIEMDGDNFVVTAKAATVHLVGP